ncbi:MAG: tetratricopeptide repeat protein [Chloroflexi bacterium]|nr:tetratricopeptide repeat protein [Chloroflexota bacterium]
MEQHESWGTPANPSPRIHVHTLGTFALTVGEVVLPNSIWRRRKAIQLFKWLLTQPGRRLLKDQAVDWLWPDSQAPAAFTNLRTAAHAIRRALRWPGDRGAPDLIWFDAETMYALGQSVIWVDADEFELAASVALGTGEFEALRTATALYGGAYLPDDIYEDWSGARRERLRRLWFDVELKVAKLYEQVGQLEEAARELQRLAEFDPGDERIAAMLMRLHMRQGRRSDALRVFHNTARDLRQELDVAPSQALVHLHHQAQVEELLVTIESSERPSLPLPVPLTSFIGREREMAAIRDRLETARLVTLVGPGGVGKTRLAIEAARSQRGAVFVDLSSLADPQLMTTAVAAALGIREQPDMPLLDLVSLNLSSRRVLLLLDNCEHLVQACAMLTQHLLRKCPHLQILATSRERLDVPGEHLQPVQPLTLPDLFTNSTNCEAVRLFVDRARLVQAEFQLSDENSSAVLEICRQLDGIPLAIELAAARLRALGLNELVERLSQRLCLLTGGSRTLPERQQTLRATIDWSYALLDPSERQLFERLSVFHGGWTLEAAEGVAGDEREKASTLDLLTRLVDQSMVDVDSKTGGVATRYRLLDTIRQYGDEYLERRGEAETARGRHAKYFLQLAERADRELRGPAQRRWLEQLSPEQDNLREALSWAVQCRERTLGLRLCNVLWRFWMIRGHFTEGRRWFELLLGSPQDADISISVRAAALCGLGQLAFAQASLDTAQASFAASLKMYRRVGDSQGIPVALSGLGRIAQARGHYLRASGYYERSLALYRQSGDTAGLAACLDDLGEVARHRGDYQRAEACDQEALLLQREVGDEWGVAFTLNELANVARHRGQYERGQLFATEALDLQRDLGDLRGAAISLNNLGIMAQARGQHQDAERLYEEALRLFDQTGDKRGVSIVLPGLSTIAAAHGRLEQARALAERALQLHREQGEERAIAQRLDGLGRIARLTGDLASAQQLHRESLDLFVRIGDQRGIAMALDGLATLAASNAQRRHAAELFGASSALYEAIHAAPDFGAYVDPRTRDELLAQLRASLGEEMFARAWAHGRAISMDRAVAEAFSGEPIPQKVSAPRPSRSRRQRGEHLTAREWDVVRLVAQGRTNREIGQALVISSGTARTHIEHVLGKLGMRSRAEIAAWVAERMSLASGEQLTS